MSDADRTVGRERKDYRVAVTVQFAIDVGAHGARNAEASGAFIAKTVFKDSFGRAINVRVTSTRARLVTAIQRRKARKALKAAQR